MFIVLLAKNDLKNMDDKDKIKALIKKINTIHDAYCADDADRLDDAVLDAMDLTDELNYPS